MPARSLPAPAGGFVCLSCAWNDNALKWLPLDAEELVRLMLHSLQQIYPTVDIASHIVGEAITVSREDDPNFMGAFSHNLAGRYRYQERLHTCGRSGCPDSGGFPGPGA